MASLTEIVEEYHRQYGSNSPPADRSLLQKGREIPRSI